MASVKGTNFTNITADPIVKIDSGEWSGKMRVQYDTYEASSLASGSDISVARLPNCLLYTSPSPRDRTRSRMPSSA